jgi:hypothetical protein
MKILHNPKEGDIVTLTRKFCGWQFCGCTFHNNDIDENKTYKILHSEEFYELVGNGFRIKVEEGDYPLPYYFSSIHIKSIKR